MQRLFFLALLILAINGCATYSDSFKPIEVKLSKGEFDGALELIEKNKGEARDIVLYMMNKAMVLRMKGEFEASNQVFEAAKAEILKVEAISISEQAGAIAINDGMRSYAGESYERVMLHVYKALNYLELNDIDGARIEALQIDELMQQLPANDYAADSFSRYLAAMIFEDLDEDDTAMVFYRKSHDSYIKNSDVAVTEPDVLKADLLRLTEALGFDNEHAQYKEGFQKVAYVTSKQLNKKGELVVIVNNNLVPIKTEHAINAQGKSGRLVRISVPLYQSRPHIVEKIKIKVDGKEFSGEITEDIAKIARYMLNKQLPLITARAVARAVVKDKTASKAGEANPIIGLIVNIFGFVSERADTRSWVTLPQNIHLARIPLDAGTYDITVELLSKHNKIIATQNYDNVKINNNQKTYKTYHWVSANR